jgi:hypothetical protein
MTQSGEQVEDQPSADDGADDITAPLLIAGPILRRLTPTRLSLWCALSEASDVRFTFTAEGGDPVAYQFTASESPQWQLVQAGEQLYIGWLDIELEEALPRETRIPYQLCFASQDRWFDVITLVPHLLYPGQDSLSLEIPGRIDSMLHGSCRKPHHPSGDGLVAADGLMLDMLAGKHDVLPSRPSLLLMSGDQVYTDDVAGPMLYAIHQTIELLGIYSEDLADIAAAPLNQSSSLYKDSASYFERMQLLPEEETQALWYQRMIGGAKKPVFTSVASDNHLITLAEHLAMYLLVWSPMLWERLRERQLPPELQQQYVARYNEEQQRIDAFCAGLPNVQRLLAHVATAMIFDDHDVTDDWNLNRDWEEAAYGNGFSRRIIGNALISYLLCQGWGNCPERFEAFLDPLKGALSEPGSQGHDQLIDDLIAYKGWEYTWQTSPELVVLDTRTRRWPSESNPVKPSGLLDWEAITDLQQTLKDKPAVLLVSAGPIFGVKLIELIQHTFARLGKPLVVDAENWSGHPGTAQAILNVFLHPKTPQNFVILSGDVHYSFVYDVELRRQDEGPDIWQICSSGLKNEFPKRLLDVLDILNRWLYSPRSPLNMFTRRRRMRVVPRKPEGLADGRRLLNGAGIGVLELDEEGRPWRIRQLLSNGTMIGFDRMEDHAQYR